MTKIGKWIGKRSWGIVFLLCILVLGALWIFNAQNPSDPTNYAECAKHPEARILEIYPEQCVVDGKSFTNDAQASVNEFKDDSADLCDEQGCPGDEGAVE